MVFKKSHTNKLKKNRKEYLRTKKRRVMVWLAVLAIIQLTLVVLARYFLVEVSNQFAKLGSDCLLYKLFFGYSNKLSTATLILSSLAGLIATTNSIDEPKTKGDKRYNKRLKLWSKCFVKFAGCVILDSALVGIFVCLADIYCEFKEFERETR